MSADGRDSSESYLHFYAKQVLIQWLQQANGRFFSLRWNPLTVQLYPEYPLIIEHGRVTHGPGNSVWSEVPSKICHCPTIYTSQLLSSATYKCRHSLARSDHIPSRIETIVYGHRLGAIVDVALIEDHRVKYVFEVVHTSPVSPMKRKLLLDYCAAYDAVVYQVDCDYILRQACSPSVWRGVKLVPLATAATTKRPWRVSKRRHLRRSR